MTKPQKMKTCDIILAAATIIILASGIQLEATGGTSALWVWLHIFVGTGFIVLIGWHLHLHFQWRNWIKLLTRQKSPVTRWLSIFYVITIISAVAATVHWLTTFSHAPIGGIHGKLAFIFIALCIGHFVKRIKSPILK